MKQFFTILILLIIVWSCESNETKGARFFLKGNDALNDGDYKEAIRLYTEAIDKYPKLQDAYNNRGVAYYKSGDSYSAIQDYTKLIMEMNALHWNARNNRVDAYASIGKYEEAIKELNYVQTYFPDSAAIDFKKGLVNFDAKEYRSAIVSFNYAYKKDSSDVEALVNAANSYFYYSDFDRAYAKLDDAMELDPNEPNIYNTRCMMEIANGRYELALGYVEKALEIDPNNGIYLNNRGFLKLMLNDVEEGGKDIDKAIVSNPQNAWAYRNKGIFYFMNDQFTDAIRNFETSSKIEEDLPLIDYYWGASLIENGKKDLGCEKLRKSVDRFENQGRTLFEKNCGVI